MTYEVWQGFAQNDAGDVLDTATVTVTLAGTTTKPALFADEDGTGSKTNPFTTDASGFVQFYTAPAIVDIVATKGAFAVTFSSVRIGLPDALQTVASLAELQGIVSPNNTFVREYDRNIWIFDESNLATAIDADEVNAGEGDGGILIAPASDKTGASGAWRRQFDGDVQARWYGGLAWFNSDVGGIDIHVDEVGLSETIYADNLKLSGRLQSDAPTQTLRPTPSGQFTIDGLDLDVSTGYAVVTNSECKIDVLNSRIHSTGMAVIYNEDTIIDGSIIANNHLISENADGLELNTKNGGASNIIASANILEGGLSGSSSQSGFALGVARTNGFVAVGQLGKGSRQEALHLEDFFQNNVHVGQLWRNCKENGVHILEDSIKFGVLLVTGITGTFVEGEPLTGGTSGAVRTIKEWNDPFIILTGSINTLVREEVVTGGTSGATATISQLIDTSTPPNSLFSGIVVEKSETAGIADKTDNGFQFITDTQGTVQNLPVTSSIASGFRGGFNFGEQKTGQYVNALFAHNCTFGYNIRNGGVVYGHVSADLCQYLYTGTNGAIFPTGHMGRLVDQVLDRPAAGASSAMGCSIAGLTGEKQVTLPGGSVFTYVPLFPMTSSDRMNGHIMYFFDAGGNGGVWYKAKVTWNGTTLTITDNINKNNGTKSASTPRVDSGNFEIRIFNSSGATHDASIRWKFEGDLYLDSV